MATANVTVEFSPAKMADLIETATRERIEAMDEPLSDYQRGFADAIEQVVASLRRGVPDPT